MVKDTEAYIGGHLKIAPDVRDALLHGNAVVALESTIISHGMPYPENLCTAKEVEAVVKENGAIPATIAILDGVPCIGNFLRYIVLSFYCFHVEIILHW
ncbi:pseudouridine-5'-phosphate glycosidase isoform X2 [Elaeis guineensis]|uniref:pseudouridine-5'-phosphate glycosidase isoform X2 n=1 Tax=Elaeis guineensis var. tenera TaxID=51953 RepID=UPI003C6CCEE2